MWGIVPAAGRGTRIQPLAFSKELLPVGSCRRGDGERPCAVSERSAAAAAAMIDLCCMDVPCGSTCSPSRVNAGTDANVPNDLTASVPARNLPIG